MLAAASSRVIVITGATRGCGRAMVERFVDAGHTVFGCGRSADSVQEVGSKVGPPNRFDVVDVADDHQVAVWAKAILQTGIIPDLLINNAAIMNRTASLWDVTADEFQEIVNINLVGTANVIRHFVPAMVQRRSGVIVNFSSGWGRSTAAEVAPYLATKYAIEGLSQALAKELPKGMASVPLNPGIINTEMLQSCWADGASAYPSPDQWSRVAVPYLLKLNSADNGRQATVPI